MFLTVFAGLSAAAGAAALLFVIRHYLREREESTRVRELFSRYVPTHVVKELLARRRDLGALWAERHYATVLCCRIKNFGFFAEELSSEQTLQHLNEFYAVAGRAIVRHGGVIERLHADGITAIFGVLTSEMFQEERALRAALRIVRLANAMNKRWEAQGRRPFQAYIGVNSGNVVAGEVGFAQRREFAIVGNPAHVAAQLQQLAEEINAYIVAASSTFGEVKDLFTALPLSAMPLAGLRRLQSAFIVRGLSKLGDEELLHLPAEIAAMETVIAEPPPVSGEYEAPARVENMPLPAYATRWYTDA